MKYAGAVYGVRTYGSVRGTGMSLTLLVSYLAPAMIAWGIWNN
jgi:hypothetical protein